MPVLTRFAALLLACSSFVGCANSTTTIPLAAPIVQVGETDPLAVAKENSKDKPSEKAAGKDPKLARQEALEEAAEYGIIGLLDTAGPGDLTSLLAGNPSTGTLSGPVGILGGLGTSSGGGGLGSIGTSNTGGLGTGSGFGGLGLRGTGSGGGGGGGVLTGESSSYGFARDLNYERPKARIETANIKGGLTSEVVARVLSDHRDDIQDCYVLEASRGSRPHGRITLAFTISDKGHVTEVRAPESTISSRDLQACIAQVFGTFEFPAPATNSSNTSDVSVSVPVSF